MRVLIVFLLTVFTSFASIAIDFKTNYAAKAIEGLTETKAEAKVITDGYIKVTVPDGKGGKFIGGEFTSVYGVQRNHLAHILADNTVDPAWNPNPDGIVDSLVVNGSNLIVLGKFNNIVGQQRNGIANINISSGQLNPWNPNANGFVYTILVNGNTIYIGGNFTSIGGQNRNRLAAVDATTGLATAWNPNANGKVYSIVIYGANIYVGGEFTVIGGQSRNYIAAVDTITGQSTPWSPNANDLVYTLAISGRIIYVGGDFTSIGGKARNHIAALDISTGQATNWDPNMIGYVYTLAINGSLLFVPGWISSMGGQFRNNIGTVDTITGLATNWNPNANDRVFAIALSGNIVYVGGMFTNIGGQARNNIAAIDVTTGLATSWNPNANGYVRSLAVKGNVVYAGGGMSGKMPNASTGMFTFIGGQPRNSLAALDATTGQAISWNPNPNGSVSCISLNGSSVYIGGDFTTIGGQVRNYVAEVQAACTTPTTPTITASGPTTFCSGGSVTLTAPVGFTYLWSNGATTQSIIASTAGSYTVQTISGTCTSAASQPVAVSVTKIDVGRDTSVCAGVPVTLTARVSGLSGGTSSSLPANLQTGLVGYWPFNGNANDVSSNRWNTQINNHINGSALLTEDRFNQANGAFRLSGIRTSTNKSIIQTDFPGILGQDDRTINFWFKSTGTEGEILYYGGQFGGGMDFYLTNLNGNSYATIDNSNSAVTYGPPITLNNWHMGTILYSRQYGTTTLSCRIYIDTILLTQVVSNYNGNQTLNTTLGNSVGFGGWSMPYSGDLDEIAFWNRQLSSMEIKQLFSLPQYLWSTGATTPTIQVNPTQTTSYWCTVTTNGVSCTDTVKVTVNTPPTTPTITAGGATTFCSGGSVTLTAPAGFTYLWSNGATTQSITASTAGSYTVRTIANGCTSATSAATVVTVNTPPTTPTITAGGATTFCTGGSVTLTAPGGFSYLWSNGATTQSITASTAGSYTVRTIANGCTSAASTATVVTVNTPPITPTITAGGATTFCSGGSVTLTAPAGFTYLWSNGATTQSITASTAGSYTVRTIANGCTSAASTATVVTVITPPTTPTITAGGATTFCSGGSVTLTAPAGFTYLWSNGATTQSISANTAGSYTVRTIANGCTSAASAATVVTVNTPPTTPTITAGGATTFCSGGSVTLTAPAGFTYLWSNGATTQSITASTAGSYTVRTIANGCTSAASAATVVTVNTPPTTPTITAGGATTFCSGGSVTLTAPAGFTYLWSNGATTQSITANTAGSYTVRTIANGCTSATSAATVVTVNTPPTTPTITAGGATTFCTGGSVTLTAPAGFTYLWSNGATTQSITANTAGSYTVRTIANGCTSATSAATVVTVNTPPATPTITAGGATTFCTGGSVTLTAPAGFTYLWSNGATTQSITASTAGSYTVRTIANGCTSAASTATVVTVNTPPTTPTITAGGATTFCTGGSVTLTAPAGFTYLWSNGATTQSITANTAGSYTVRTIANGCTSAASTATVVTVANLATPTITTAGLTTIFPGGTVTLTAPAGFSYLWSNNATTQSITVNSAGSYSVRTVLGACTSAASAAVTTTTQPNFELYADTVYTKAGGVVSVPVRVRGFSSILGMQGEITLPAGTTYQNISNLNATLGLTVAGNFGLSAIGQNTLYFTWDDQSGVSRTITNGSVLFNLDLTVGTGVTPGNVLPILFPNTNSQFVVALGSGVRVPNANIVLRQGAVIIKGLISGKILTRSNIAVPGVRLNVRGGFIPEDTLVAANGTYSMSYPAASGVVVSPRKTNDVNRLNGIDVMDMTIIRRHILGSNPLNSAYRAVAADVDRSNSVTASDLVFIRDLILRNRTVFPQSRSWVFVRSNQTFANQNNPWPVDTFRTYATTPANAIDQDFVACKLGDVDESYNNTIARRGINQLQANLTLNRAIIRRIGDTALVSMTLSGASSSGIQFTTRWDSTRMRFAGVASSYVGTFYSNLNRGTLTLVSTNPSGGTLPRNLNLITIKLVALASLQDSAMVTINSDVTPLVCYDSLQTVMQVNVTDGRVVKLSTTDLGHPSTTPTLIIHPNPASNSVQLNLSHGDIKQVEVIDQLGRTLIHSQELQNSTLDISNLAAGTYVVRVVTSDGVAYRKLIKQ